MKLTNIHDEITVNVTTSELWVVLARYGDVSSFHGGVKESFHVSGSQDTAEMGGERICNIVDMGLKIQLKERIVKYVKGESYQYEVYEWKNFPVRKMLFKFSISEDQQSNAILKIDIDYKAKPAFLTPLMVGKMKKLARDILLGYKHYTETGEINRPIKGLRKRYNYSLNPNRQLS